MLIFESGCQVLPETIQMCLVLAEEIVARPGVTHYQKIVAWRSLCSTQKHKHIKIYFLHLLCSHLSSLLRCVCRWVFWFLQLPFGSFLCSLGLQFQTQKACTVQKVPRLGCGAISHCTLQIVLSSIISHKTIPALQHLHLCLFPLSVLQLISNCSFCFVFILVSQYPPVAITFP